MQTRFDFARRLAPLLLASAAAVPALASEFSVSPVRAELRPGALSETITVSNRGTAPIRVGVKVMEWTQDADGKDLYTDSNDLVYFPRQMALEPNGKRLVRVGAKAAGGASERTFRMFIEELPEPAADPARAQVGVYFRFGVPVFLTPASPRMQADIGEPALAGGKLSLLVKNSGNQHFRINKVTVDDGAGFAREIGGWYTLAGAQRTYALDLPREVCRKARTLSLAIEGEAGLRADRKLHVDPARCN
jgi:fimbrial chaperone protein